MRELEHLLASAVVAADGPIIAAAHLRSAAREESGGSAAPGANASRLFERIVHGGESFWEVVQGSYLRRELSREEARSLVRRACDEGGGTSRGAARLFRLDRGYRKLYDFLKNHDLRVG